MNAPQPNSLITLSYINPTQDHPYYSKHRPPFSQQEIGDLVSALKSIGVDFYACVESGEIPPFGCTEIALAIKERLSELATDERSQKRWLTIADEFWFSGGIRVVTRERKATDIPPYSR